MNGMRIFDHLRWDSFRPAFFYRLCSRPLGGGKAECFSSNVGLALFGPSSQRCGRMAILRSMHSGRHVERLSRREARTTITP